MPMIRKGTRVRVLDYSGEGQPVGTVEKKINWDRTYFRVLLDDGRTITSERVERAKS